MRILLITLFLCSSYLLNAQNESTCTQTISGEVRDQFSNELLPGAEMVLLDKDGKILESQVVTETASFSFSVLCDTQYKLEGKKQEYTTESKSFTTSNDANLELKTVVLLGTGEIDFVSDAANKKKEEVKKDSVVVAPPKKTEPEEVVEKVVNEPVEKSVAKPIPKKESTPNASSELKPIYFDYESSWLNEKGKSDLRKVVQFMNSNPQKNLECRGHADSKGESSYNQWMSDRRAKRVIDFLISNGMDPSRITGKGYGETRPINNCTDTANCTDAQRAVNRRTEFIVRN